MQPCGVAIEVTGGEAFAAFVAGVHPEAEHQQAIVADAAEAFQLAGDEDGAELAVDRAFIRNVLEPLHAEIECGLPRAAKAFGARAAAQVIGALGAHVDVARGAADAAGIGEGADEGFLARRGPAIVAVFDGDAVEGGEVFGGDGDAGFGGVLAAGHAGSPDRWARGHGPGGRL